MVNRRDSSKITLFQQTIAHYGAAHRRIPPASPTYNSMAEAFNRLSEDECYGNMWQPSWDEFIKEATDYQRHFNFERVNTYRGANPWALLQDKAPEIDPEVLDLPPILLDSLLDRERCKAWRAWQDGVP